MPSSAKPSLAKRILSAIPDLRTDKMRQIDQANYAAALERGRLEHWREMLDNDVRRSGSSESGRTLVSEERSGSK